MHPWDLGKSNFSSKKDNCMLWAPYAANLDIKWSWRPMKKQEKKKHIKSVGECIKNSHGCEEKVTQHHAPLSKEEETPQF